MDCFLVLHVVHFLVVGVGNIKILKKTVIDCDKFILFSLAKTMSFWTLLSRQMIQESPLFKGARKDPFLGSRKVRFSLGERCQLFAR